jgi:hypothetical protein
MLFFTIYFLQVSVVNFLFILFFSGLGIVYGNIVEVSMFETLHVELAV